MICWPGGSKSRLGKAAGAEVAVQQKHEKWHAAVARSFFKSKCTKHHLRTTFANWDVDKWQAAVARSTFVNQNVQSTPCWDYFLKFLCRKIVRRCCAKRIYKPKMYKTPAFWTTFGDFDAARAEDVN